MSSSWRQGILADEVSELDAGVSVNADDRAHSVGETGVLKTSAVGGGSFDPKENKAIWPRERTRARVSPEADSILVSRMNTPALVGESAYVADAWPELFLPDRIWQLRMRDRDRCRVRWVAHLLQSHRAKAYISLSATGTSGSMKNLPKSRLLAMPVSWPPSKEQHYIAEILDTLDKAIRKTEQLIAKLKQVKQGLLHDLLTRGIDDNGELRDPARHSEQFKDSQLGRIPTGWEVVPAGDVFDIRLGKMMNPGASAGPNQRQYLRNQNVLWDRLDLSDVATMHFDTTELEKFRLRFGDLLACEGRFIGRCAIWRGEINDAYYQKALHRLRARDDRSTTDYMLFFMSLRFQYDRGFVEQMSHESTIPHLPLKKLIALPMLLPPRVEQDHIVGRLRAITAREQLESDYLAKAKRLKAGLMEDLLTGRIRVTSLLNEGAA